jgi:hypothetical protein
VDILPTTLACLKLLLVLSLCYVAGAGLFAACGQRTGAGPAVVWFSAGFCLLSFVFLLSKVVGSALVFFAGLPVFVIALQLIRKPALRMKMAGEPGMSACALTLVFLSTIPVLLMGVRMGSGDYPAEFFAGDSPFFLQQVYALIRTGSYPPPSLETYGFSFKYHYGFQAFVALTSMLTGLKPHLVMFGIVQPLLELLAGIVVYQICRRLSGHPGAALLCLFLVLFGSKQYLFTFHVLDPAWWQFLTHEENFNFRYPNGPDTAGFLVALCAVRCTLEFDQKNFRLAALFFTCMLPVFKIPYLVPIGAGVGLVYCYELRRQFRAGLLIEIGGAALLSALNYVVFSQGLATAGGVAGFKFAGFLAMSMPWDNETLLILSAVIVVTAVATRRFFSGDVLKLFIFAVAPYLVFLLWRIDTENEYQIFSLGVRLLALFTAVYFVAAWLGDGRQPPYRYAIAAGLIAGLTGPGVISAFNHIYVVSARPEQGHEYADNRSVADALMHIPLDNTVIATNDLRYPANGFSRDYRQFQLAGIFGHQNFAADLVYGGFRSEDMKRYARFLKLFQLSNWPGGQIGQLRRQVPITHLLIHKNFAHAEDIPLSLEYENENYRVYRF